MPTVELRDIVTDDDEAVMGLRRGPGRGGSIGRMAAHSEDAAHASDGEQILRLDPGQSGDRG